MVEISAVFAPETFQGWRKRLKMVEISAVFAPETFQGEGNTFLHPRNVSGAKTAEISTIFNRLEKSQ